MGKWLKRIIIFSVTLLIIVGYSIFNIKFYSVYYSQNTPHKQGVEPVLMTLIDDLYWIYQIDTPKYEYKEKESISIMEQGKQKYLYYPDYDINNKTRSYSYSGSLEKKKYIFDDKFNLKYVLDTNTYNKLDINLFDEQAIKQEMHEVYKELIDRQPTPSINLQWLFDWLYHDKFN